MNNNFETIIETADELFRKNRYISAYEAYSSLQESKKIIDTDKLVHIYYRIGLCLLKCNKEVNDSVIKNNFLNAIKLKPQHCPSLFYIGVIAYDKKDYPEAIRYFSKAINYFEENEDIDLAEIYFSRGKCFSKIEYYRDTMLNYNESKRLSPKRYYVLNEIALTVLNVENNIVEAFKLIKQSIKIRPTHYKAYQIKGLIQLASGSIDEAIECFENALEKIDNLVGGKEVTKKEISSIYSNLGDAFYIKGDKKLAIEYYTKAIKTKKFLALVYAKRGKVRSEIGEDARARDDFENSHYCMRFKSE